MEDSSIIYCKIFTCPVFHDNRCCIDCSAPCEDICLNGPDRCNITTDVFISEYDTFDDEDDFDEG